MTALLSGACWQRVLQALLKLRDRQAAPLARNRRQAAPFSQVGLEEQPSLSSLRMRENGAA